MRVSLVTATLVLGQRPMNHEATENVRVSLSTLFTQPPTPRAGRCAWTATVSEAPSELNICRLTNHPPAAASARTITAAARIGPGRRAASPGELSQGSSSLPEDLLDGVEARVEARAARRRQRRRDPSQLLPYTVVLLPTPDRVVAIDGLPLATLILPERLDVGHQEVSGAPGLVAVSPPVIYSLMIQRVP
jgi:hypothetical protein